MAEDNLRQKDWVLADNYLVLKDALSMEKTLWVFYDKLAEHKEVVVQYHRKYRDKMEILHYKVTQKIVICEFLGERDITFFHKELKKDLPAKQARYKLVGALQ